ncbi:methyltransferase domain-containing protein [Actinomadura kijaniata]|uniref:Protein-L-isoaspartate O-methyltransferase n=1 Tax=Actinomadura namibiensis TaxID=182080 RepID=A0A7W3LK59_ACTNM|nr:methyltransferase domain-containing protein [Actinomadura namibiensis]MBA8949627.1 protein-L-isoaspartate(D-aspartate) O-methyltransferase [Actinomadura namibiensis]
MDLSADGLADRLAAGGRLVDERWREGLRAVPRHLFVPERAAVVPDRPRYEPFDIDRSADPDAWLRAVYDETAIAAQTDESGVWTSSCSAPTIVVVFLQELRPLEHHRVLEVGTGTGWTAGLLAWRVGERNVVSVEIDPELSRRAADNLRAAGLAPRLVVGDGAEGFAEGAPYDRVHVTCGVERVPRAWLEQTRPGGVIVMPWSPAWGMGHVARLTVADGTAVGRLTGPAGFMMLRSQRRAFGAPPRAAEQSAEADRSRTRLDPRVLLGQSPGAEVAVAALAPGARAHVESGPGGVARLWAIDDGPGGTAWAAADFEPGADAFPVRQYGARRLWDEVEAAYLRWVEWGQPDRERYGLTVTPDGQRVWLDRPDRILART